MTIAVQTISINYGVSKHARELGVFISVRECSNFSAVLVVGSPGSPNVIREFQLGDALLYETPSHGLIEVRASRFGGASVDVFLTQISPKLGFTAALEFDGGQNTGFAVDEIEQLRLGLSKIAEIVAERSDVSTEQVELLRRKLEDVASAATRLGRKDWIMFATGTVTNVVVGAAFPTEAIRATFVAMNGTLGWVFQNALRLLGT